MPVEHCPHCPTSWLTPEALAVHRNTMHGKATPQTARSEPSSNGDVLMANICKTCGETGHFAKTCGKAKANGKAEGKGATKRRIAPRLSVKVTGATNGHRRSDNPVAYLTRLAEDAEARAKALREAAKVLGRTA